ncbi:MAG TPA: putative monovalent cation/H+ antiporter subunit A [Pirellulaceae bacterium]|nr:putative monovalent cation/H+ antiporter subunit A [Pirellulaceae bacterium]
MGLIAVVLAGFVAAAVAPWLVRIARGAAGWVLAAVPLGLLAYLAGQLGSIAPHGLSVSYPWVPSLGVRFSFHLDGLSLTMAVLITGVGALVLIYAGGYLAGHRQLGRFFAFLMAFMASMLGLVLADNALTMFVFWELTSITSYLLIGFDHERPEARSAALQALLVTGAGGLALLAGLLLLGQIGQDLGLPAAASLEISTLRTLGKESVAGHALYLPALLLILGGALTKSAQFPFHFWLPSAMEAPTPVSAYLHSATMVKAGVYLLARLSPVLAGTEAWTWGVMAPGLATLLIGGFLAIQETDLKRILAYSTVSALGMLTMLLGLGSPAAVAAAMAFLLGHALYKGALFLVAGAIDHETGTRNVDQLGGLRKAMPWTATAAALAACSMAGLPPLFGFVGKEAAVEASLHHGPPWLATGAVMLGGLLFVAIAGIVGARPFVGQRTELPKHAHEAPISLWLGSMILAVVGLVLGLAPGSVDSSLLAPAAANVLGRKEVASLGLALWHGWNLTLALSALTVLAGVSVYVARLPLRWLLGWGKSLSRWGPAGWYELGLKGLNVVAAVQTRLLQSGYLRLYLLTILVTTVGLVGYTLLRRVELPRREDWFDGALHEASLVSGLIALAVLATILARSRMRAIVALGVVGYGVALLFVLFGAPDLAMTQFLVETLTVILFVLVFYYLSPSEPFSRPTARLRDATVAIAVGALMTVLVLVTASADWYPSVSGYYAERSVPDAHGRNIVNVILVDFRGLDTLGEITVLAVAAIGVYALLHLRPERRQPR